MSPRQVCDWHSEWHCGPCEGTGRDCTMGLRAWSFGAVGHSICHPICVLDTLTAPALRLARSLTVESWKGS